ncbi:uncharacterized protein VTP21DRAFT_6089 [Calcarisporiella thermophila]|uniref:uncharacterized protein n=1 Tax=Calcarisporiella thermophila TaxID=911321 RepID=UPI003742F9EA
MPPKRAHSLEKEKEKNTTGITQRQKRAKKPVSDQGDESMLSPGVCSAQLPQEEHTYMGSAVSPTPSSIMTPTRSRNQTFRLPELDERYYSDINVLAPPFNDGKLWQDYVRHIAGWHYPHARKTTKDKLEQQYFKATLTMAAENIFRQSFLVRWPSNCICDSNLKTVVEDFCAQNSSQLSFAKDFKILGLDCCHIFQWLIWGKEKEEILVAFEEYFQDLPDNERHEALNIQNTDPIATADNWRRCIQTHNRPTEFVSPLLVTVGIKALARSNATVEQDFGGLVLEPLIGTPLHEANIPNFFSQREFRFPVTENWAPIVDFVCGVHIAGTKIPVLIVEVETASEDSISAHKDTRKMAKLLRHSLEKMAKRVPDGAIEELRTYGLLLSSDGEFEFVGMKPIRERKGMNGSHFNFCLFEQLLEGILANYVHSVNIDHIVKISSFLLGPVREAMVTVQKLMHKRGPITMGDRFPPPQIQLESRPGGSKFTPSKKGKDTRGDKRREESETCDRGSDHQSITDISISMLSLIQKCGYQYFGTIHKSDHTRVFHVVHKEQSFAFVAKLGKGHEISLLQKLQDLPNIVRLYNTLLLNGCYGMILDKVEVYGRDFLKLTGEGFMRDLFSALKALHTRGIIHHDIKPNNIGYSERQKRWVLLDFNFAEEIQDKQTQSGAGTETFIAPEVERHEPHGFPADIYSAGRTLQALNLLSKLGEIGDRMLSDDPNTRPTASEVLEYLEIEKRAQRLPTPEDQILAN